MTHIQQFIEDAIKGGYLPQLIKHQLSYGVDSDGVTLTHSDNDVDYLTGDILLDPLAWQAVGKTRGWMDKFASESNDFEPHKEWVKYWHRFIDHLADGKTIEDALLAIT